jgi:DNA-binding MarR family transcriptional regulator
MATKNEELLGVWSELFVGHALAVREIETQIQGKATLSLDEYDLLLVISRSAENRLRFSALADATIYTRSGITRIAKRMIEEGYLEREECPSDKRGAYAVLTDKGKAALRETWRWYSAAIVKIFSPCFNQDEAKTLAELLSRIPAQLRNEPLVQIKKKGK